jgi:hypothetical protein
MCEVLSQGVVVPLVPDHEGGVLRVPEEDEPDRQAERKEQDKQALTTAIQDVASGAVADNESAGAILPVTALEPASRTA